ncbi:guanine deaminase [Protaetiibacter intestinalis]|uniref:Guanine deaminase n=1 Tax=Protaetiibacter intestinalis TaxID=2419774 RepID=A0A387B9F7_9MICO|nr:guanine deaminase [Protaetiibacter intestinalis]AYF99017.1 guanine deaminase [Protaetiibacter intestinalis]
MSFAPAPEGHAPARAIRGHLVTITGDPFGPNPAALVEHPDGLLVMQDGLIAAVGPYAETAHRIPPGATVDDHRGRIVSAGFVDAHTHYPQTGIVGAHGAQLIDWLENFTFPAELAFTDPDHAAAVARVFFDTILRAGTTTALSFGTSSPVSVDAFFAESLRRGTRMVAGKVLMDRNAPAGLLDTADAGAAESAELIARWHGTGRNGYAVTPRFAPTSTRAQLDAAGELLRAHPGVLLHTHLCENDAELAWVRELFPEAHGYLDVYDRAGLVGERSVFAHGIHLRTDERARLADAGAAIAHCPSSNLFLGSGLFSLRRAADAGVRVALGTDIGAGTSFSLLRTMASAYEVAHLDGLSLGAAELLYLATLGGARALGLGDRIGSLEVGKEADLVVLDPAATELLAFRSARASSVEELLFVLATLGDDRTTAATYVAGHPAYLRD